MILINNFSFWPAASSSLTKRMLIGGIVPLVLMAVFLLGVKHPNPDWGKFWTIRPLVIVSLSGAGAIYCYYILEQVGYQGKWNKGITTVLGVIGYVIALFLGFVLGLDGTLWN